MILIHSEIMNYVGVVASMVIAVTTAVSVIKTAKEK